MKKSDEKLKKKLYSKAGETIAETLVTMIILSLAVIMIAGAVVTAARVNKKADNTETSFRKGTAITNGTQSGNIIISEGSASGAGSAATDESAAGGTQVQIPVTVYQSGNNSENTLEKSYIYYELQR